MHVTRRDFLKYVAAAAAALGIDAAGLGGLERALAASSSPPIVWLQGALCTGCSVSLLNLTNPGIEDVLLNSVSLRHHSNIQASAGDLAISCLVDDADTFNGEFILVVEGAVPTAFSGRTCIVGQRDGAEWTMLDAVSELGAKAKYVVSVGTCASFGGIPKESPYTASKPVAEVLGATVRNPVVNLPGCPAHPNTIVGALVTLLTTGMPQLGTGRQPTAFYPTTVHRRCPRLYSMFTQVGSNGCYFLKGCRGPWTVISCPVHKWNNGVSWCIQANMACIGCAAPDFPRKPLLAYGLANARVDWRAHQVSGTSLAPMTTPAIPSAPVTPPPGGFVPMMRISPWS